MVAIDWLSGLVSSVIKASVLNPSPKQPSISVTLATNTTRFAYKSFARRFVSLRLSFHSTEELTAKVADVLLS